MKKFKNLKTWGFLLGFLCIGHVQATEKTELGRTFSSFFTPSASAKSHVSVDNRSTTPTANKTPTPPKKKGTMEQMAEGMAAAAMDALVAKINNGELTTAITTQITNPNLVSAMRQTLGSAIPTDKIDGVLNNANGKISSMVDHAAAQATGVTNQINTQLTNVVGETRTAFTAMNSEFKATLEQSVEYSAGRLEKTFKVAENTITTTVFKIGGITLITFATGLALKYLYDYIKTPKLAIENSENKILAFFKYTVFKQKQNIETIDGLILEPETKKKVTEYRNMLFFAQKNKAPMTNVLLYGPPGTGKTEIGKRIAKQSNSTFVYFSGASLAAFKENEAIKKMKEMFEWAQKKGNVIIFIDEIETLLPSRLEGLSEQRRNLLTEFLTYTGKRSNKFAIIGASNLPQAMDGAIARRFDKAIKIGLPGPVERLRISHLYQKKLKIAYPHLKISLLFNNVSIQKEIMHMTDGLSGGEIESVWTNTALKVLASSKAIITPELIKEEIQNVLEKKNTIGYAFAA